MAKIGGYQTILSTSNGFQQISKKRGKSNLKEVNIFVAGGPEIDKKVEDAQKEIFKSIKQKPLLINKSQNFSFLSFFKNFINIFKK